VQSTECATYPEGNFGVNQLPDGSMGLSPLCRRLTSDLHVSIATCLHPDFSGLRSAQAKITIFRVSTDTLGVGPRDWDLKPPGAASQVLRPASGPRTISLLSASGLTPLASRAR